MGDHLHCCPYCRLHGTDACTGLAPYQRRRSPHRNVKDHHRRGPIGQSGRWYTDGQGRAILTAGVNMVSKRHPYSPEADGFDDADAAWLQKNGFDSVRLGVIWKGVEPKPGEYDDAYLASITRTVRTLRAHGIMTLLDAHQDMYNEKFEGEGAPDWAVLDKGAPNLLKVGFPANQVFNLGLIKAYDSFLDNAKGPGGVGLQDRYAAMWKHVAQVVGQEPGVMGYDIINEPWPGHHYPICYVAFGWCGRAMVSLDTLYEKVGRAITSVDPDGIVTYEPYSTWNMGLDSRPARPSSPKAAISWHVYCPMNAIFGSYVGCNLPDTRTFTTPTRQPSSTTQPPCSVNSGPPKTPALSWGSHPRLAPIWSAGCTGRTTETPTRQPRMLQTRSSSVISTVRDLSPTNKWTTPSSPFWRYRTCAPLRAPRPRRPGTSPPGRTRPRGRLNVSPVTVTSRQDPSPRSPSRLSTTPMVTRSR
ncbi:endoglycoceramidase [Cutibacterium acnes JCM 18916]|nr:endoglycoceramidase [Cutibacterium acnes JCM 18916]